MIEHLHIDTNSKRLSPHTHRRGEIPHGHHGSRYVRSTGVVGVEVLSRDYIRGVEDCLKAFEAGGQWVREQLAKGATPQLIIEALKRKARKC